MMQDLYGNLPARVGELLEEIGSRGVSLRLSPSTNRLNCRPKDGLTPELVEEIRKYKVEIIEVIRWDEARKVRREGIVSDELEVLEMARRKFGTSE
jgi:hypothetical protein